MAKTASKFDKEMFAAIEGRSADDLERALKAGANPNAKGPDGQLPIDQAANEGRSAIAKALLEAGADISEAGFGARAFAWLLGMSGGHKAAIEAEMRESFRPLLEDPRRRRWVDAIRVGDIQAAVKANKIPKDWTDVAESIELLPFHPDTTAYSGWSGKDKSRGGLWALRYYASEAIPFFLMSPVEAFVTEGNHKALDEALSQWSAPARRCRRGFSGISAECPGAEARGLHYGYHNENLPLVGLAALKKDETALQSLIRSGLCPNSQSDWIWVAAMARGIAEIREHESVSGLFERWPWEKTNRERSLASLGVSGDDAEAIEDRLLGLATMSGELDGAVNRGGNARVEALRLLAEGAPPSIRSLAQATEHGDTEMVRALLEAGLNPNVLSGLEVPMLAELISSPKEALAIWLEHGASPLIKFDSRSPDFGDDAMPSALYRGVSTGDQEMAKMLLEKSAEPVKLVFSRFGKLVSPMEQLATSKGDEGMALFLRSLHETQLLEGAFSESGNRPERALRDL